MRHTLYVAFGIMVFALTSCDDGGGGGGGGGVPGEPVTITLNPAVPATWSADGGSLAVSGSVTDFEGTVVPDGTVVTVALTSGVCVGTGTATEQVTTTGGSFVLTVNLTNATVDCTITVTSGASAVATATVDVLHGAAAGITIADLSAASPVVDGGTALVTGTVTDAYGNPVSGVDVTLALTGPAGIGLLSATTVSVTDGGYSAMFTSGTLATTGTVTATLNLLSANTSITTQAMPLATIVIDTQEATTNTPAGLTGTVPAFATRLTVDDTTGSALNTQVRVVGHADDTHGNPVNGTLTVATDSATGIVADILGADLSGSVPVVAGVFEFYLAGVTEARVVTVNISSGIVSATPVQFTFQPSEAAQILALSSTTDPIEVVGGGGTPPESTSVTGTVLDGFGNVVETGTLVSLSSLTAPGTTPASIAPGTVATDAAGAFTCTFSAGSLAQDEDIEAVAAAIDGTTAIAAASATTQVTVVHGVPAAIAIGDLSGANPLVGGATVAVSGTVVDTHGNAVDGVDVTLAVGMPTDVGSVSPNTAAVSGGAYTATFTSGTLADTASLSATYDLVSGSTSITTLPLPVSTITVDTAEGTTNTPTGLAGTVPTFQTRLTVDDTTGAGSNNQVHVAGRAEDVYGNVVDATLTVTTDSATGIVTDASGVDLGSTVAATGGAFEFFLAGVTEAGTITVSISSGLVNAAPTLFTFLPSEPDSITSFGGTPSQIQVASGGGAYADSTTLTGTVLDAFGNPVGAGVQIALGLPTPQSTIPATFSAETVMTDASGTFATTLNAGSAARTEDLEVLPYGLDGTTPLNYFTYAIEILPGIPAATGLALQNATAPANNPPAMSADGESLVTIETATTVVDLHGNQCQTGEVFDIVVTPVSPGQPTAPATASTDADGTISFIVTAGTDTGTFTITATSEVNAAATTSVDVYLPEPNLEFVAASETGSVFTNHIVLTGDVDHDGILDVVEIDPIGKAAQISFGDGTCTFGSGVSTSTVCGASTTAVNAATLADIDLDGYLELVVAADNGVFSHDYLPGSGEFQSGSIAEQIGSNEYVDVEVSDYDIGGWPDILAMSNLGVLDLYAPGSVVQFVLNDPGFSYMEGSALAVIDAVPSASATLQGLTVTLTAEVEGSSGLLWQNTSFGVNADASGDDVDTIDGVQGVESIVMSFNRDVLLDSIAFSSFSSGAGDEVLLTIGSGAPTTYDYSDLVSLQLPLSGVFIGRGETVILAYSAGNGVSFDSFDVRPIGAGFVLADSVDLGTVATRFEVADVTNDAHPDVVVIDGMDIIHVENSRAGGFGTVSTGSGTGAKDLALADMDRDGDVDVVLATSGGAIQIHRNTGLSGNSRFAVGESLPLRPGVNAASIDTVRVADLGTNGIGNKNGQPDVIAGYTDGDDSGIGRIAVWIQDDGGDATFTAPSNTAWTCEVSPGSSFEIGDIDRDGNPDLVVAATAIAPSTSLPSGDDTINGAWVIRGLGTDLRGFSHLSVDVSSWVNPPYGLIFASGDFLGDGGEDVCFLQPGGGDATTISFRGGDEVDSTVPSMGAFPGSLEYAKALAADINDDGTLDIAYCAATSTGFSLNPGAGDFPVPSWVEAAVPHEFALLGPFALGHGADFLVHASGALYVLANNGADAPAFVPAAKTIPTAALGGTPYYGVTGHFNDDALIDVAYVAGDPGRDVVFLFGRPFDEASGYFTAPATPQVTNPSGGFTGYKGIAAGDFDSDGVDDIVLVSDGKVTMVFPKNNGTDLSSVSEHTIPSLGLAVSATDFDRDGNLDVVLAAGFDVQIMLGDGSGGLVHHATHVLPTGSDVVYAVVGLDLNHDGIEDFAAMRDGRIFVYRSAR